MTDAERPSAMEGALLVDGAPIDYSGLPDFCRDLVRRYIEYGDDPGTGWRCILQGNLSAVVVVDDRTREALPRIYRWIVNHAPRSAWGSAERVEQWTAKRCVRRMEEAERGKL